MWVCLKKKQSFRHKKNDDSPEDDSPKTCLMGKNDDSPEDFRVAYFQTNPFSWYPLVNVHSWKITIFKFGKSTIYQLFSWVISNKARLDRCIQHGMDHIAVLGEATGVCETVSNWGMAQETLDIFQWEIFRILK